MSFSLRSPYLLIAARIAAAVAIGVALRFVVGLNALWWLAWLAPAPLLALSWISNRRDALWMTALAALIGASVNFHYFSLVMPLPFVLGVLAGQTLLWVFVVMATRRIVVRYRASWTSLAYPLLWVAVDSLTAALLPDGNWGSLAYTQSDFIEIMQVASLFGTAGVLFLLALLPSVLAHVCVHGRGSGKGWLIYAGTPVLLLVAAGYGYARLQQPVEGEPTIFGMVAIDDAIGARTPPAQADAIWRQYDERVAGLAMEGAQIVVMPEKIAVLTPQQAQQRQARLGALAAQHKIWLEAGVGVDDGGKRTNLAWLFNPDGRLASTYQKRHMAPPEREFIAGSAYEIKAINGAQYGLAICKDMHFAALGREYGARRAAAMLVPAWDFYFDAGSAARMTSVRGIENGYAVLRASREGMLTASDAYGRVIAERRSKPMPGAVLLARLPVTATIETLYTRIGNLFGWLCTGLAVLLLAAAYRRQTGRDAA